jgi:hypothetical protein
MVRLSKGWAAKYSGTTAAKLAPRERNVPDPEEIQPTQEAHEERGG